MKKERAPYGFFKQHPYLRYIWSNLNCRCSKVYDSKYKYYGGKGIKNLLTLNELLTLWARDKADKMKQASIDRIDINKDYSLSNCRFIEMEQNRLEGLNRAKEAIKAWNSSQRNLIRMKSLSKNFWNSKHSEKAREALRQRMIAINQARNKAKI